MNALVDPPPKVHPRVEHIRYSERTGISRFRPANGCDEYFVLIRSKQEPSFDLSLKNVLRDYLRVIERNEIPHDTLVFSRFILSDIQNQKALLLESELFKFATSGAYSIIGQPPAFDGGGIYFLAYHITGNAERTKFNALDGAPHRNALLLKGQHYQVLYAGAFSGADELNSNVQTHEVFSDYRALLNRFNMTLAGNCWRTWIYIRDIDNHYAGMVNARVRLFRAEQLTENTRYIASTGIEAKSLEVDSLVTMDSLAISGMRPEQAERMEAEANMCPTHRYGVTFERGQTLIFGDRKHHHISGTASIDADGNVLHPNDIVLQTHRALENISALLAAKGAVLNDMAYFIVYMRNPSENTKVREAIYQVVSKEVPILFVEGAVCRPSWLVEIEGMAISHADNSFPHFI